MDAIKKQTRYDNKMKDNYAMVCEHYDVDQSLDVNSQIETFIEIGKGIQSKLCENHETIEDLFEQAKQLMKLNKGVWNNLISMNIKRGNMKDSSLKKLKEKLKEDLYYLNTRSQFVNNNDFEIGFEFSNDDVVFTPKEDSLEFSNEYDDNTEVGKLLRQASMTKLEMNELAKDYHDIKLAVEYLTGGQVNTEQFKTVVDFYQFAGSTDDKYPDKLAKFTNKINDMFSIFAQYDLKLFDEYLKSLGLKIVKA